MAECANPLLLQWVSEWLETARERNTKGVTVYKKAYDSLKSCPLPFTHPSEAQQLHGFGPKLCDRLTEKLKEYCEENGLPMPMMPHKRNNSKRSTTDAGMNDDEEAPSPKKKARKVKPYVPALRSGAYALVLALSSVDEHTTIGLTKQQCIELAQPHCDSSFSAPSDPTKFYTAWNSMKTLVDKDLVYEKGRPLKRYALSEEGWEVAKRIKLSSDPIQGRMGTFTSARPVRVVDEEDFDDLDASSVRHPAGSRRSPSPSRPPILDTIPNGENISSYSALPSFSPIILEPGSFTVELVLDVREVRAKQDRDYMQNGLSAKGVTPIMRALELGDILWVAKLHDPGLLTRRGAEGDEVVLDYVAERKRLDDLVSSIKDGRFHEQKFRLRKSGIKNVIYIVEEISMNADHFQKYEEAVQSAIASTQVVSGYFLKKTQKMDDTIRYLAKMTKLLKKQYEAKPLHLIPPSVLTMGNYLPLLDHLNSKEPSIDYHITYSAFASISSKSEALTLKDVYLKMLMCTRGITGEKALEIQKRWKTPIEFIEAFREIEKKEGRGDVGMKKQMELVSSEMGGLVGRKRIAKALSMKVAEVWGNIDKIQ